MKCCVVLNICFGGWPHLIEMDYMALGLLADAHSISSHPTKVLNLESEAPPFMTRWKGVHGKTVFLDRPCQE